MSDSLMPKPAFKHSMLWIKLTNTQVRKLGTLHTGENSVWLEIEKQDSGFFLHALAEDRKSGSDTWHQSLEDAFHQAEYSAGVSRDDWNKFHN
jgi:hypothetical protein